VQASLVANSDGDGYRLHVLDAEGHTNIRQVSDAATAASLIESWAVGEDADVWASRTRSSASSPEPGRDPQQDRDRAVASQVKAQLGVAAETSVSSADAIWWGGSATACARLGALCVGGRASISRSETTLEIDRTLGIAPDLARTLGGLSALVAWPVSAGRFWVAPSVGVGAAWFRSRATQAGVTSTSDDVLARGDAGAVTGVTIGRGWSVTLALGASVALVVHGDPRQGTTTYLPAVPRGFFTAGVGVGYAR
jgi:hypothetical protein